MARPGQPANLSDLLEARAHVRKRYGPGLMDELPGEAMYELVGEFCNRTPHLKPVGSELALAAVEAVAAGETMGGPDTSTIAAPQGTKSEVTLGDWLYHPSEETDEAFNEAVQNLNRIPRADVDEFGRAQSDVEQMQLPPDLANEDDYELLEQLEDVTEYTHPNDLIQVARHLKTNAPTHSGIDVAQLPPDFTTPDALEELTHIKSLYTYSQFDVDEDPED